MSEYYRLGTELGDLLRGLLRAAEAKETEDRRLEIRKDPLRIPRSLHFASVLAYGDFILASGETIRCEAIPGISGVFTSEEVQTLEGGHPQVHLQRILTHFHFDHPSVLIEQHYSKSSGGTLTGASRGNASALLPGKASFSQFIILTLNGLPLTNREPLVMTAQRVDQWPPIGATFVSEAPTDFFELDHVNDPAAARVATLAKCAVTAVQEFLMPVQ